MSNHKTTFGLVLLALLASLLAACGSAPATEGQEQPQASLPLEECQLAAPGLNLRVSARCATLAVPEDRAAPQGRMINLRIAVLPALSRSPAPDPLFLLAGGPGQAATEAFVPLLGTLERINQERDLVLVDQRGTGQSNPLQCAADENSDGSTEALVAWARSCAERQNADLTKYTTSIAMDDLDQVRAALGYEQINLLGVSYGTRAAQSYLRQYPNRVRTLILDGVLPQDEALGVAMARDAQRAFDQMVARCRDDATCNQAFPNVAQDFSALLAKLDSQPLNVTLNDPFTGQPT
ncbi:MAG: alpha/beta hydrolase, partial [Chloroflexaceae bacterium]|nr:alpha/beta hydrolase [Chloroflexaceae bacterium]